MNIITRAVEPLVPATLVMRQTNLIAEGGEGEPIDTDLLQLYTGAAVEWAEDYLGFLLAPTLVELTLPAFPEAGAAITLSADALNDDGDPIYAGRMTAIDSILYTAAGGTQQVVEPTFTVLDTRTVPATISLAPTRAWPAPADVSPTDTTVRVRTFAGYTPVGADPQTVALPQRITAAILMVAAHLYRNRESTTAESLSVLPMGPIMLLHPLKRRVGFA